MANHNEMNNVMMRRVPRLIGAVVWGMGLLGAHILLPSELSRVAPGRSTSIVRAAGLLFVAGGGALVAWAFSTHVASAPQGWSIEPRPIPTYLLRSGPYRLSRNPMYVGGAGMWLGWALFYGSPAVWAGSTVWAAIVAGAVRKEERFLLERFGDSYREYVREVPRWLGPLPTASVSWA